MAKQASWNVSASAEGFTVEVPHGHSVFVPWQSVTEVRAFKLDRLTTDEVRLRLAFSCEPNALELSEEWSDFKSFLAHAEGQLNFPANWWSSVILRHFVPTSWFCFAVPNYAVNTDAHRRRFAPWWSPVTLVR
jgi:hypothetical protein